MKAQSHRFSPLGSVSEAAQLLVLQLLLRLLLLALFIYLFIADVEFKTKYSYYKYITGVLYTYMFSKE